MLPIRDENPSGTFPIVTLSLIAVNIVVFLYELSLGPAVEGLMGSFGLVPARVWRVGSGETGPVGTFFPFLTCMFLHGGPWHLLMNMWYLWIFGDNIEDRLGHLRFILFYLGCGVGASAVHVLLGGPSNLPMVGASGAISGVLGAYFICFPGAKVLTLVPIFIIPFFVRIRAFFFLFIWIATQVLSATVATAETSPVAWWAHIGGFALGFAVALFCPAHPKARQSKYVALPDRRRPGRYGGDRRPRT